MPIQILPPQLANQIAAGEVVERPASIIKELMENSLDAGATRIEVEIEQGGAKLIRIRDNGSGINKQELALALARHATSKIATLDDLEAIVSLGFRGEALAGISSVSRLTLTSRTAAQQEAWQVYAEGRDMEATVKPAAHPVGTTVEVLDLFYNTPARRKFLRTEKTEFSHIDEMVRRIALARCDIAIDLQHNGKSVRQYRPAKEPAQQERRLAAICGAAFVQQALALSWQHGSMSIEGWVADPAAGKNNSEIQYCYVNGRMMRDRLINHAIRQAYQHQLSAEQQPAYVLYLHVDPQQVDVNVHPAKHEVRFHQARLVHDFIYQAVLTALQQTQSEGVLPQADLLPEPALGTITENRAAAGENQFTRPAEQLKAADDSPGSSTVAREARQWQGKGASASQGDWRQQKELYQQLLRPVAEPAQRLQEAHLGCAVEQVCQPSASVAPTADAEVIKSFGRVLMVIAPAFALLEYRARPALLALPIAERWLRQTQLTPDAQGLRPQPLLIPLQLTLDKQQCAAGQQHQSLLTTLGIELVAEKRRALLKSVPLPLRQQNLQQLLPALLNYLAQYDTMDAPRAATWLARQLSSEYTHWSVSQAVQLLAEVERLCPQVVQAPPAGLLQMIDLQSTITALNAT